MCPVRQTNLPCVDNVAFGMERIGRSQTSGSQRMALVDLSNEASISMEPLRPSGGPQGAPSDGELTPHTGEINIAVTSKSRPVFHRTLVWSLDGGRSAFLRLLFCGFCFASFCLFVSGAFEEMVIVAFQESKTQHFSVAQNMGGERKGGVFSQVLYLPNLAVVCSFLLSLFPIYSSR